MGTEPTAGHPGPEDSEGDEMLTFKEAQALLRISRTSMYRFIEQKRLTPVPSSTALQRPRVLFRRAQVISLLEPQ